MIVHHPTKVDVSSEKQARNEECEIDLIDVWLVLVRWKKVVIGTILVSVLLGIVMVINQPEKYNYRTSIAVGGYTLDGKVHYLESKKNLENKIKVNYLPRILNKYNTAHPDQHKRWELKVSNDEKVLVIEGVGNDDGPFYLSVLQSIVDKIKSAHQKIMINIKKEHEIEVADLTNDIARQQDQIKLLEEQKKRIKQKVILKEKNLKELERLLQVDERNAKKIMVEKKTEVRLMMLLMLNYKSILVQNRVADLREKLLVLLPNEHDMLDNMISDLRREQKKLEDKLLLFNTKFEDNQNTYVLEEPKQALVHTVPDKRLMIIFAMLAGCVLGIFIAFFMEFLKKAHLEYKLKTEQL